MVLAHDREDIDVVDVGQGPPGHVAEGAYGDLLGGRKTMDQYVDEAPVRAGPVFDDEFAFFVDDPGLGSDENRRIPSEKGPPPSYFGSMTNFPSRSINPTFFLSLTTRARSSRKR